MNPIPVAGYASGSGWPKIAIYYFAVAGEWIWHARRGVTSRECHFGINLVDCSVEGQSKPGPIHYISFFEPLTLLTWLSSLRVIRFCN